MEDLKKFRELAIYAVGESAESYKMCNFHRAANPKTILAMLDQIERLQQDADRLDALEREANQKGGILLHDGSENGHRGLGLRPGSLVRTLLEAVEARRALPGIESIESIVLADAHAAIEAATARDGTAHTTSEAMAVDEPQWRPSDAAEDAYIAHSAERSLFDTWSESITDEDFWHDSRDTITFAAWLARARLSQPAQSTGPAAPSQTSPAPIAHPCGVRVCPDRDIECGDFERNWCASCPKRN